MAGIAENRRTTFCISSDNNFALLKAHLNETELPQATKIDNQVFKSIIDLIYNLDGEETFFYENSYDLELDNLNKDQDWQPVYEPLHLNDTFISYDYCVQALEYKNANPSHSFATIQHFFRKIKDRTYLTRFKNYVDQLGTAREKYIQIAKHTYETFVNQRALGNIVHDRNLRVWAIAKARELHISNFSASQVGVF
jgi:hypothetical protein